MTRFAANVALVEVPEIAIVRQDTAVLDFDYHTVATVEAAVPVRPETWDCVARE